MIRPPDEGWENQVRRSAQQLPYPPTPELAARVAEGIARPNHKRRWLTAALALVSLLITVWAAPPLRATMLDFLQIGSVRIWLATPTPLPPATPGQMTPRPTPMSPISLFDLAGATTLAEAEERAGFRIRLPTYPPDLGAPDGVFYQEIGAPLVVLVWLAADNPHRARLSLHILAEGAMVEKGAPTTVTTTTVHGQLATWTTGPYLLAYRHPAGPQWDFRHLVEGHVLVWVEQSLTYRLETALPLGEAVRVAESLARGDASELR